MPAFAQQTRQVGHISLHEGVAFRACFAHSDPIHKKYMTMAISVHHSIITQARVP
jgi:hypothetical protein